MDERTRGRRRARWTTGAVVVLSLAGTVGVGVAVAGGTSTATTTGPTITAGGGTSHAMTTGW